jgi:hypothetical protein
MRHYAPLTSHAKADLADGDGAYIVLSLLVVLRTEEVRALRWDHVDLDGDPDTVPAAPPHVAVWRSVRIHGETKTSGHAARSGCRN